MGQSFRLFAILLSLSLTLYACQPASEGRQSREQPEARVFSDENKRIARALSIGSEVQTNNNVPPQYEAALCSLALAAIGEPLRNSHSLSQQQIEAFDRAEAEFRRRAAVGLSPEQREKTRKEVAAAYPEQSDRARVAIGCLRKLA